MNDENFYAWLAGFIDGEGCWKIYNGKPYFELCQKGWNGHRMLTEVVNRLGWSNKVTWKAATKGGPKVYARIQCSSWTKLAELAFHVLPHLRHDDKKKAANRMLTYSRAKRENRGPQATPSQLLPN